MTQPVGQRASLGAAMVEFALLLPVLFIIFAVFWDNATRIVALSHAELAMLSLQFNFTRSPQVIVPDPVTYELRPSELTGTALNEFQEELQWLLRNAMADAGSFADPQANVAIEMYYWEIDAATGTLKDPSASPNLVSPEFYRGLPATEDNCFGPPGSALHDSLKAQFKNYVDSQWTLIKSFQSQIPPIRFGENIYTSNLLGTTSSLYFDRRATVFIMTCARRPFGFFSNDPITTFQTFVADKEASWQIAP